VSLPPSPAPPVRLTREKHREERRRRARRVSRILRAGFLVFGVAVAALLAHGANRPEDPYLEPVDETATGRFGLPGFEEVVFRITDAVGATADWCALLARTQTARAQGLMHQRDLRGYDGMVFEFEGPTQSGFYMRNTRIPLSIAFFDADGAYVGSADMEPCPDDVLDCPTHAPDEPYTHALEVMVGDLPALGVEEGSTLSFPGGSCRPGESA
jgi:uncharacterized protein